LSTSEIKEINELVEQKKTERHQMRYRLMVSQRLKDLIQFWFILVNENLY